MSQNLNELVEELCRLIIAKKYEEALNNFYSDTISTGENENPPIVGLEEYKKAGEAYLENISNYRAILKNRIISDDMSVCEWHYTFDHSEWGHWDKIQLSVQRWKNGKIFHERHYYNL